MDSTTKKTAATKQDAASTAEIATFVAAIKGMSRDEKSIVYCVVLGLKAQKSLAEDKGVQPA